MAGWSDLSECLQQKCVKEMSFLSRRNLRNSSKSARQLVDKVPLKVPRVRFAEKKERFLVVIYTGVGKFVRIEFRFQRGEKIVIEQTDSENPEVSRFIVKSEENGTWLRAKRAFIAFLEGQNFELDTLEIGSASHYLDGMVEEILKNYSLKFNKISYDCLHNNEDDDPRVFFNATKCLNQESFFFCMDMETEVPVEQHQIMFVSDLCEAKNYKGVKVTSTSSTYYVKAPEKEEDMPMEMLFSFLSQGAKNIRQDTLLNVRFPNLYQHLAYNMFLKCPGSRYQLENNIQMKRLPPQHHDFVHRFYMTDCGFYVQMYRASLEKLVDNYWPYPCGIGNLCKKHGDPFESWYFTSIPKRIDTEPYWTDTINIGQNRFDSSSEDENDDVEMEMTDEDFRKSVIDAMRQKRAERKKKVQEESNVVELDDDEHLDSEKVKMGEKKEVMNPSDAEIQKAVKNLHLESQISDEKDVVSEEIQKKLKDSEIEKPRKIEKIHKKIEFLKLSNELPDAPDDNSIDSDPDSECSGDENAPPTIPIALPRPSFNLDLILNTSLIILFGVFLAFLMYFFIHREHVNFDDFLEFWGLI